MAYGARGPEVEALQGAINHCHNSIPDLAADGIYGDATRAAVRTIQTRTGIKADGEYGPNTYAVMSFPA
ncbi:peptidoglycan-binding protein [Streptomyces niveus]|uniref:peptidoglycan-binding domain-containing protein n=1 Tax=Streptomyces niveus TaxID=193462 RepID=UPI0036D0F31D